MDGFSLNQIGRNLTLMMQFYRDFLNKYEKTDFLLIIGFHDTHRCTPPDQHGPFCEAFGSGKPGQGRIPDWKPIDFDPENVTVPFFVQDSPASRRDLAAMYTSVTRLDRGIELMLAELEQRNLLNETLLIYTSDNGIPFPSAKTTLYDPGMQEPLIISNPNEPETFGKRTAILASTMDMFPTLLDWFNIPFRPYHLFKKKPVFLTGKSLLPITRDPSLIERHFIFASQSFHNLIMNYPMRVVRTHRYKLIHNLSNRTPFPIASDLYLAPTYQDLYNKTAEHWPTGWYKSIDAYYYRPEFELYDLITDPAELKNLADIPKYESVFERLRISLHNWQNVTMDPWICAPHGVLEYEPPWVAEPGCYPLYNEPE